MRASYQKELAVQEIYHLKGDQAHHLLNVVRVEQGEEILLLNGSGLMVNTKVSTVAKRELTLEKLDAIKAVRNYEMDLALGIPKKDALELTLKQAVELGFRKIFLIRSKYSQIRVPEVDRLENILASAIEQSNAPFMPEIAETQWAEISAPEYDEVIMLDSQTMGTKKNRPQGNKKRLLVVGPEGGFSSEETALLHGWPNMIVMNLPTPILRTPTAVAAGAGILLGSLLD